MDSSDFYQAPWSERYSSKDMLYNFSNNRKYGTWRKLWIALAEAQKEAGLPITKEQIDELKRYESHINYDDVYAIEQEIHHDVMAHIKAYGKQCPSAAGIIHMGATSCFVTDNTDLIQMKEALKILHTHLLETIHNLCNFAEQYKDFPTVGYTHFQVAQASTIGKRACLWLQSFMMDYQELLDLYHNMPFRGLKGAVGTASGPYELLNRDYRKFKEIDKKISDQMGFSKIIPVSGQTYDRKIDSKIVGFLGQIAQSAHKFSTDLRLLQHMQEIQEPFGGKQVGSSAMPHKRNPILAERIGAIAKFVMALEQSSSAVAATQWLERTLDDSANKRITIPQAFLGTDAILLLTAKLTKNLTVNEDTIRSHVARASQSMALEKKLMQASKSGQNRQEIHEELRRMAHQSQQSIQDDLPQEISIGFAVEQTEDYISEVRSFVQSQQL